jgi:hypothetical protein
MDKLCFSLFTIILIHGCWSVGKCQQNCNWVSNCCRRRAGGECMVWCQKQILVCNGMVMTEESQDETVTEEEKLETTTAEDISNNNQENGPSDPLRRKVISVPCLPGFQEARAGVCKKKF